MVLCRCICFSYHQPPPTHTCILLVYSVASAHLQNPHLGSSLGAACWAGDGVWPPQQIDSWHRKRGGNSGACCSHLRVGQVSWGAALLFQATDLNEILEMSYLCSFHLSVRHGGNWMMKTRLWGLFEENWGSDRTHFSFRNQGFF